jgi:hypothetical protein
VSTLAIGLLLALRPVLSGPEIIHDSANFRVHYTLAGEDALARGGADAAPANGVPDDVDAVESGIAEVMDRWVAQQKMRAPLPDGGGGGDPRIDVYLRRLSARGAAHPEDVGRAPAASAWLEVDSRSALVSPARLAAAAGHEAHHAIQYAYTPGLEPWIYEATATWVEHSDFSDVSLAAEAEQHLAAFFDRPEAPLDRVDGVHEYDAMVFVQFLADQRGGDARVPALWEAMLRAGGAAAGLAADEGRPLELLMADFARANALSATARGVGAIPSSRPSPLPALAMTFLRFPTDPGVRVTATLHGAHTLARAGDPAQPLGDGAAIAFAGDGSPMTLILASGAAANPDLVVEFTSDSSEMPDLAAAGDAPTMRGASGCGCRLSRPASGFSPLALILLAALLRARSRAGRARPSPAADRSTPRASPTASATGTPGGTSA